MHINLAVCKRISLGWCYLQNVFTNYIYLVVNNMQLNLTHYFSNSLEYVHKDLFHNYLPWPSEYVDKQIRSWLVGWLVGWLVKFYGNSTFVDYLTPNLFLCK